MNRFLNTVKEENRHTDNLEDLYSKEKLSNDCYLNVKEILEKRYRNQLYLDLNMQNHDHRPKYNHGFIIDSTYRGKHD